MRLVGVGRTTDCLTGEVLAGRQDIEARDVTSLASSQGGEDEEGDALCLVEPAEDEEGCRDRRRQQEVGGLVPHTKHLSNPLTH